MTETKTDGNIIINVRLFCTKKPDLKYLTRFQCKMPWEVRGKTLRLKLNPEVDTVATLKKKIEETRGTHAVETLCKGGAPYGIVLEPDTATLASVGLTRSHSVWEYLWEDSEAEQALFQEELDKVRGYVHEFMLKHPDMKGGRNTGEKQPEEETWSKKQRRKRTEMEKAGGGVQGDKVEEGGGEESREGGQGCGRKEDRQRDHRVMTQTDEVTRTAHVLAFPSDVQRSFIDRLDECSSGLNCRGREIFLTI